MLSLDEAQRARLVLMHATRPPAKATNACVLEHGALRALQLMLRDEAPDAVNAELCRPGADIRGDLQVLQAGIARFVTPEDDEWPTSLLPAEPGEVPFAAPLGLWVKGRAALPPHRATLAVTGSTRATDRGLALAARFAGEHARRGTTLVTSYPSAIGGAALQAALDAGGMPIVVLACGLGRAGDDPLLAHAVDQGGLVVSQYPTLTRGSNRRQRTATQSLAIALANATVIVETDVTSRGLLPGAVASTLGRSLFAVPCPEDPESAGTNRLIERGRATAADDPADIGDSDVSACPQLANPA